MTTAAGPPVKVELPVRSPQQRTHPSVIAHDWSRPAVTLIAFLRSVDPVELVMTRTALTWSPETVPLA